MSSKQRGLKRPILFHNNEKKGGWNKNTNRFKNDHKHNKNRVSSYKLHVYLGVDKSFEEQVDSIISQTDMTDERRVEIDKAVQDVSRIFSAHFPDVEPVVFGSVLADIAFKNSDVDIHLRFGNGQPEGNFIQEHGEIFYDQDLFSNVLQLNTARVPIIKAEHKATRVNVDISCQRQNFGVSNSLLVRHLCSVDPRVKKMIKLIIIWSKFHTLNPFRFSTFTITLLVLFYLQVVKILPPFYKIIKQEKDGTWPTDFYSDPALLSNCNNESISSLFLGLFTFYSAVHFEHVILSTFAGEIILVSMFKNPELMPQCFHPWKSFLSNDQQFLVNEYMNVQEPFNLSLNTTRNAISSHVELLKRGCLKVCDLFSKFCLNQCLEIIFSNAFSLCRENEIFTWTLPCPENKDPCVWRNECTEAIKEVLSKILLMDILNYDQFAQNHNFAQFHIIRDKSLNSLPDMMFIATTKYNVCTKARGNVYSLFSKSTYSDFEKEVKTSKVLLTDLNKKEITFRAIICVHTHEKNKSAQAIFMNQIRGPNVFQQIISFLKGGKLIDFIRFYMSDKESAVVEKPIKNKGDVQEITSGISCSSLNEPKCSQSYPEPVSKQNGDLLVTMKDSEITQVSSLQCTVAKSMPVAELAQYLDANNGAKTGMNYRDTALHDRSHSISSISSISNSNSNLSASQSSTSSHSHSTLPVQQQSAGRYPAGTNRIYRGTRPKRQYSKRRRY